MDVTHVHTLHAVHVVASINKTQPSNVTLEAHYRPIYGDVAHVCTKASVGVRLTFFFSSLFSLSSPCQSIGVSYHLFYISNLVLILFITICFFYLISIDFFSFNFILVIYFNLIFKLNLILILFIFLMLFYCIFPNLIPWHFFIWEFFFIFPLL